MRKILAVCVLALGVSGCCGVLSRERAYHDGVKAYAIDSGLLGEYERYVDNDLRMTVKEGDSDETRKKKNQARKIRHQTVQGFRALIAEEDRALEKEED